MIVFGVLNDAFEGTPVKDFLLGVVLFGLILILGNIVFKMSVLTKREASTDIFFETTFSILLFIFTLVFFVGSLMKYPKTMGVCIGIFCGMIVFGIAIEAYDLLTVVQEKIRCGLAKIVSKIGFAGLIGMGYLYLGKRINSVWLQGFEKTTENLANGFIQNFATAFLGVLALTGTALVVVTLSQSFTKMNSEGKIKFKHTTTSKIIKKLRKIL